MGEGNAIREPNVQTLPLPPRHDVAVLLGTAPSIPVGLSGEGAAFPREIV